MDLENKHLNSYTFLSIIGRGGMAEVWRANQVNLKREVAIKVIMERSFADDSSHALERFEREAHAVAKLDHPNILPVIDYGRAEGFLYIVMPWVRGGSLLDHIKNNTMTRGQAFSIYEQLLSGLSYAHRQGFVHRDLKPANILLHPDGRAVIADFGVAKSLFDNPNITQTGVALGSPQYMAPEQFMGHAEYRSDLYSAGVILYRMLTGQALYSGTSSWEIGMRHINDPLPLPHPLVPKPLEAFLYQALAKRMEQRFLNAEEMSAAFHNAVNQLGPAELQQRLIPDGSPPAAPAEKNPTGLVTLPINTPTPGTPTLNAGPPTGSALPYPVQPEAYRPATTGIFNSGLAPAAPPPAPVEPTATATPPRRRGRLVLVLGLLALALAVTVGVFLVLNLNSARPGSGTAANPPATATAPPAVTSTTGPAATTPAAASPAANTPGPTTPGPGPTSQPTIARFTPPPVVATPPAMNKVTLTGSHSGPVNSLAWSPDGRFFVTASDDKTLKIWDAATNKVTLSLDDKQRPHADKVLLARWSSDGQYIVSTAADKFVHLYDVKTGTVLLQASDGVVARDVAIAPDNSLVTYPGPRSLHTWAWLKDDNGPDLPLNVDGKDISALAFSADSKFLAAGVNDGRVLVWDVQALKQQLVIGAAGATAPTGLLWTPDGKQLIIGRQKSLEAVELNLAGGTASPTMAQETRGPVGPLALSPDGKMVAAGIQNGDVEVWSLPDKRSVLRFSSGQAPVIGLRWNRDNQTVQVASGGSQPSIATFSAARPPAPSLSVSINPLNGTQVKGTGVITDEGNGTVTVTLTINGLEPGPHKAHIHSGTCLNQGGIVHELTELNAGQDGKAAASTTVKADFATLVSGNHYFNVHNQVGTPTYVAGCGEITT